MKVVLVFCVNVSKKIDIYLASKLKQIVLATKLHTKSSEYHIKINPKLYF